jgi:hypothetical protein
MKASDIFFTVIILFIFTLLYCYNILVAASKNIQQNWPLYRCNPIIMPFAGYFGHDTTSNFTYCIQNIQSAGMDEFLAPLNYGQTILGNVASELENSLQSSRGFISNFRTAIQSIVASIYSVFLGLIIGVQQQMQYTSDTFNKLSGAMTVGGSVLTGTRDLGTSVVNGPPGQIMRAVGSVCFHENTLVKKNDNKVIKMKDLNLGDKLKNDSIVQAKMEISNLNNNNNFIENLYIIKGGENNEDIIVSGSHLIFDDKLKTFIKVENYKNAELCKFNCNKLYCLITNDHTIPLGDFIFHDWDDNNL